MLLAALICMNAFAGCGKTEEEAPSETPVSLKNDGRKVTLVLGELLGESRRIAVLEEIAEKYQADFPNTRIEVRSFSDAQSLKAAMEAGEVDIGEVPGEEQASFVRDGVLLDFYPYLLAWKESATLTQSARTVAGSMGASRAYLLPSEFLQDILYYRADWFEAYNEGLEPDQKVYCRTWEEIAGGPNANGTIITGAVEQLGERGRLAFAGKNNLLRYFDAMVWSSLHQNRLADPGAGYFSVADEGKSIFSTEKASAAAEEFTRVVNAAVQGALDWTEEEAVKAFQEGKAGLLLADRSAAESLRASMPEGSWAVEPFPRGLSGTAALSPNSFMGWGISASAKEQEIAAHFLTFLSNADNNTHLSRECGSLPIHLGAAAMEDSLTEGDLAAELTMAASGDRYRYAFEPTMYKAYTGYREEAEEKVSQFARGELSKADLLSYLDDYWNTACAEEGKLWK